MRIDRHHAGRSDAVEDVELGKRRTLEERLVTARSDRIDEHGNLVHVDQLAETGDADGGGIGLVVEHLEGELVVVAANFKSAGIVDFLDSHGQRVAFDRSERRSQPGDRKYRANGYNLRVLGMGGKNRQRCPDDGRSCRAEGWKPSPAFPDRCLRTRRHTTRYHSHKPSSRSLFVAEQGTRSATRVHWGRGV